MDEPAESSAATSYRSSELPSRRAAAARDGQSADRDGRGCDGDAGEHTGIRARRGRGGCRAGDVVGEARLGLHGVGTCGRRGGRHRTCVPGRRLLGRLSRRVLGRGGLLGIALVLGRGRSNPGACACTRTCTRTCARTGSRAAGRAGPAAQGVRECGADAHGARGPERAEGERARLTEEPGLEAADPREQGASLGRKHGGSAGEDGDRLRRCAGRGREQADRGDGRGTGEQLAEGQPR